MTHNTDNFTGPSDRLIRVPRPGREGTYRGPHPHHSRTSLAHAHLEEYDGVFVGAMETRV